MQPIVNDFFCGCGGMGVGFLNAGYKIAGAWDFDKYAVQSYDHNVGHHVKQADIKEMTWQDVPFAHVWAFGFPCQDLSVAGKQAGLLLKCQDCDSDFAIDPSNFTGQTTCPSCGSKNYKAASRSGSNSLLIDFCPTGQPVDDHRTTDKRPKQKDTPRKRTTKKGRMKRRGMVENLSIN